MNEQCQYSGCENPAEYRLVNKITKTVLLCCGSCAPAWVKSGKATTYEVHKMPEPLPGNLTNTMEAQK